eukprot:5340435-Amphidinium_carterae.1
MTTVDTNPTVTLDLATGPLHAARGAQRGHCHPLAMDCDSVDRGGMQEASGIMVFFAQDLDAGLEKMVEPLVAKIQQLQGAAEQAAAAAASASA